MKFYMYGCIQTSIRSVVVETFIVFKMADDLHHVNGRDLKDLKVKFYNICVNSKNFGWYEFAENTRSGPFNLY